MSVDRKLYNLTLAALMLTGTACGIATEKQGRPGEDILAITAPTKTAEPRTQPATVFERANCTLIGVSIPKPKDWSVLQSVLSDPTYINCYVTKDPLTTSTDFREGFMVIRLAEEIIPDSADKDDYARQLASASRPNLGLSVQAGTFREGRVNLSNVYSGRFISTAFQTLSDWESKIVVPDGDRFIYVSRFVAPKLTSDQDFRNYGRQMLDGMKINGFPTK